MTRDQDDVAAGTRIVLVVILVVGLGLVAAPFVFDMFERAPKGGEMLDEFRPFVREAKLDEFRGFLAEIGAAVDESGTTVEPAAAGRLALTPVAYAERAQFLTTLRDEWPGIRADMTDMLDRVDANVANYRGVDALPPFPLFPWFFVIPGVLVAGASAYGLFRVRRGRSSSGALLLVGVLGVGLVAAPVVFQMFSRAPGGGEMIDDFESMMTRNRVTTIQGYFLTLGNGESDLRTKVLPDAALDPGAAPASDELVRDWPRINREMSPFVGVMADNLDNFTAVAALPPFALFPWFFVVPGVLFAALGFLTYARERRRQRQSDLGGHVRSARRATVATAVALALMMAVVSAGSVGAAPAAKKVSKLVGTFTVEPATATTGAPTSGSYFRMVQPGGTLAAGPFVPNADSTLTDKTYTAVQPGTDGGLVTGKYQPAPDPAFDEAGNGLADLILAPQTFFGVKFAVATNKTDPQDGSTTKVPTITAAKGKLSGNLSAYGVAYGKQDFNQGAPKPDGASPGLTKAPTGTYDAKTGSYTLEWSSAVIGGPFDGFTGIWHLEGTFEKKQ